MFQREGFLGAIGIAFSVIGGTGDLLVKEWQHRAEFREGSVAIRATSQE